MKISLPAKSLPVPADCAGEGSPPAGPSRPGSLGGAISLFLGQVAAGTSSRSLVLLLACWLARVNHLILFFFLKILQSN